MNIEYRFNFPLSPIEVIALFEASGLKRPTQDLSRIQRIFSNSNLVLSAWHKNKIVGVSRSITDFNYSCYLADLAVDKKFQKQGIGRELIKQTKAYIGDDVALILLAAPEAMGYYPKVGFETLDNAFVINRLS